MKLDTRQQTAKTRISSGGKDNALLTDKQRVSKAFFYLNRVANPEYDKGIVTVPLRSCLLHHNAAAISEDSVLKPVWYIKTKPKWFTDLFRRDFSKETGEILGESIYRTDCLTSGNNRKIKAVNRFCEHFKDDYRRRKVSLWFYTFTQSNQANVSIRDCFSAFKKRLKRRGINLRGYIWILEISKKNHVHYHALVCTDRINCKGKGLPEYMKLNDVWGRRCQVEFVRKSVRYYLATYFTKNKSRIIGKRQYGMMISKQVQNFICV